MSWDASSGLTDTTQDGSLITRSNWRAVCVNPANPTAGMIVKSPDGMTYTMDVYMQLDGPDGVVNAAWYTRQIEDLHGNILNIEYGTLITGPNTGRRYIRRITASDGRQVEYSYLDENDQPVSASSQSARLSTITANGQIWEYRYVRVTWPIDIGLYRYQLAEVVRPDGSIWQYSYNPKYWDSTAGSYAVNRVVYPYGGQVDYTYKKVQFYLGDGYQTIVLASKTTSGPAIAGGTWTYQYAPDSHHVPETDAYLDVTTLVGPEGVHEYYHYGHTYFAHSVNGLWVIGLLYEHLLYEDGEPKG